MIDLEDALARIVELAPEPPDVAGVTRRARQRRTRRHGGVVAAALVVVVGVAGAIALRPADNRKRVILGTPTESVRVTLLNGSTMTISGPRSLGLTTLAPAFNAELVDISKCNGPSCPVSHSFSVTRTAPDESGEVVGRYPTGDGHELVVYRTSIGVDAVVRYDNWVLVVEWNHERATWPAFAGALNAHETADGYLVISAVGPWYWYLGSTDAPDVQLGGEAYGSDAPFAFFGPATYPAGCPSAVETDERTGQGWPVSRANGTWWCDADEHVRIRVGNPDFVDEAIDGLRVQFRGN